jgi:hypothetical protein
MFQTVTFYELNEDGTNKQGTTIEEVLRVAFQRLREINEKFPCRENSVAITKIQEAIMWLNERTRDRKELGVDGKNEK